MKNIKNKELLKNELFQCIKDGDIEGDNQKELLKLIVELELPFADIDDYKLILNEK